SSRRSTARPNSRFTSAARCATDARLKKSATPSSRSRSTPASRPVSRRSASRARSWSKKARCVDVRPLEGALVLDFSTLLPGPLATLLLAEAGADVIKIERPGGEDLRSWEPRWGSESVHFALLNRGKKSLMLDLNNANDRQ